MMRSVHDDGAPHNGSNERLDIGGRVELPPEVPGHAIPCLQEKDYHEKGTTKPYIPPTKVMGDGVAQMKDVTKRGRSPGRFPESISEALDTPEKPSLRRARSSPLQGYQGNKLMKGQKHPGAHPEDQRHRRHMTLSQHIRATSPGRCPEDDIDTMPRRPDFIGRHRPNQQPKKSILKNNKAAVTRLTASNPPPRHEEYFVPQPPARGRTMNRDHHNHHEGPRELEETQMQRPNISRSKSLDPVRERRQYEDEDDSSPIVEDDEDEVVAPNIIGDDFYNSTVAHSSYSNEDDFPSSAPMDDELEPPNQPQVQLPLQRHRREQLEMQYILAQQQVFILQEQRQQHPNSQLVDPEDDIEKEKQRELQFQRLLNSISGDDDSDLGYKSNENSSTDQDRRHSYDHDQRRSDVQGEIQPRQLTGSWRTYRLELQYDEEDEDLENERESRFQSVLESIMHTPSPPTTAASTEFGSTDDMIAHQPQKQQRRPSTFSSTSSVISGKKRPSKSGVKSSPALRRPSVRSSSLASSSHGGSVSATLGIAAIQPTSPSSSKSKKAGATKRRDHACVIL